MSVADHDGPFFYRHFREHLGSIAYHIEGASNWVLEQIL